MLYRVTRSQSIEIEGEDEPDVMQKAMHSTKWSHLMDWKVDVISESGRVEVSQAEFDRKVMTVLLRIRGMAEDDIASMTNSEMKLNLKAFG